MGWQKEYLDIVLVPIGLLIMFGYYLYLLYRCIKLPQNTVIGNENHYKRAWVERMMQVELKDRGLALTVLSSNITVATFLSSTSLALSSLIGAWVGSSSNNIFMSTLIYGDTRPTIISIKYISILSCFLVAFACFVQCARCFVHANFLISTPDADIPMNYVQEAVISGSTFWSIGLRVLYLATSLLLWILGPIPMFVSTVITVVIMHILDTNSTLLHQFKPVSS